MADVAHSRRLAVSAEISPRFLRREFKGSVGRVLETDTLPHPPGAGLSSQALL